MRRHGRSSDVGAKRVNTEISIITPKRAPSTHQVQSGEPIIAPHNLFVSSHLNAPYKQGRWSKNSQPQRFNQDDAGPFGALINLWHWLWSSRKLLGVDFGKINLSQ